MGSRRALVIVIGLVAVLLVAALLLRPWAQQAALVNTSNVGIARAYQLDTTIDDSLFIIADEVDLGAGSHVTGDAAFVSSDVVIEGQIDGDLTVTGEVVVLGSGARVGGDLTLIAARATLDGEVAGQIVFSGEQLVLSPGMVLGGQVARCSGDIIDQRAAASAATGPCADLELVSLVDALRENLLQTGPVATDWGRRLGLTFIAVVFSAFLLAAVATLSATLFPSHIEAMDRALRRPQSVAISGLLAGLLLVGMAAGFVVLVALIPALAALLAPVTFIVGIVVVALAVAGTIPIALRLGNWLVRRVSSVPLPPLIAATAGSLVLAGVVLLPLFVPYGVLLSLMISALLGVVAVGVALDTRLGTRGRRTAYLVQA